MEIHNYQLPIQNTANTFHGFVALPTIKGKVVEIASEVDYSNVKGVKEVVILNKVGDYIDDKFNTTKMTGYIIIEDSSCENLRNKLIDIYNKFNLKVEQPKFSIGSIYGS